MTSTFPTSTTGAGALAAQIAGLADLPARQADADRLLAAEGAGHVVHDLPLRADGRLVALESRPWRLDPIPVVIDGAEFVALADRAVARMRMFEAILTDLYGPRELLRDAVVDPVALWGCPRYRLAAFGTRPVKRWLTSYAVDVIRTADGQWHAVHDVTDAPAGVGYGLLSRAVTSRVHRDVIARLPYGAALRSLEPFADRLRDGLADVATNRSPRIVVLSGGVDHPSFLEQSYLATRLGLNLVEGADLVVRRRRVWLRSLSGLEPVDVLFRRLEDDRVDPLEANASGSVGVPGLLLAARSGGVRLANAHGTGVIEDPSLVESWEHAGEWLTGRSSYYQGASPLPRLAATEWPHAQWWTYPCFDGRTLDERAVTLRLHLVADDVGVDVLQGASARVLNPGDTPTLSTAATSKDVWVIGGTVAPPAVRRREPLPQVDLISSVPTRAAEALFWAGRAMERAELTARAMDVVLDRTSGAVGADVAAAWVGPGLGMLASIAGIEQRLADVAEPDLPDATFALAIDSLVHQLGSFLAEISSVREFFSTTAGRVLARLAGSRAALRSLVPESVPGGTIAPFDITRIDGRELHAVLIDLASLVGLWNESIVRGPAWRFGEVGRRIERAFGVIDTLRGAFGLDASGGDVAHERSWLTAARAAGMAAADHRVDFERQRVVEMVLATNDSLVAYRRRHRSDLEFQPAARLVIADTENPRSLAAAVRGVRYQAERLDWPLGVDVGDRLLALLTDAELTTTAEVDEMRRIAYDACDRLSRDLVTTRLATPADPRRMGRS